MTRALLKRITDMVTTVSSLKECFGSDGWFYWYFPDYSQSMHFIAPLGENLAE